MLFSDYLCSPDANVYDIEFTRFKIRDLDGGNVLFEIAKPAGTFYSYTYSTSYSNSSAICDSMLYLCLSNTNSMTNVLFIFCTRKPFKHYYERRIFYD